MEFRFGSELNRPPGQAGVSESDYLVRMLQGYNVKTVKATRVKQNLASAIE